MYFLLEVGLQSEKRFDFHLCRFCDFTWCNFWISGFQDVWPYNHFPFQSFVFPTTITDDASTWSIPIRPKKKFRWGFRIHPNTSKRIFFECGIDNWLNWRIDNIRLLDIADMDRIFFWDLSLLRCFKRLQEKSHVFEELRKASQEGQEVPQARRRINLLHFDFGHVE